MLSVIELQGKKVEAKRKKYDKDEMDAYLELVYENYRQLVDQNKKLEMEKNELSQKVKKLSDGVQYYRSIETTLQKALILAEKTSKETKDAAILKAESIEKEANKRADEIIRTAEGEYNRIKGKCVQLVQQFNQYKTQLIEAASAQLEMVERDEFDITDAADYEQKLNRSMEADVRRTAAARRQKVPANNRNATHQANAAHPKQQPVRTEEAPVQKIASEAAPTKGKSLTPEEILTADTIDLGSTFGAVRSAEQAAQTAATLDPELSLTPNQPEPSQILAETAHTAPSNDSLSSVVPEGPMSSSTPDEDSSLVIQEPEPSFAAERSESSLILDGSSASEDDASSSVMLEAPVDARVPDDREPSFVLDEPTPKSVGVGRVVDVKSAATVEPIQAKTVTPKNLVFDDEPESSRDRKPAKAAETVPTLDSLLQDLNLNNKNNKNSDDPFEFLGSTVDDF